MNEKEELKYTTTEKLINNRITIKKQWIWIRIKFNNIRKIWKNNR